MSLSRRSLLSLSQSLQCSHSFFPSLSFSRSVQRGLWAAQWRIWRLFSTVSFVTSSTSDTRSLTTTSIPTTMHTNRYMGCTCTTAAHTHTVYQHTDRHTSRHFLWSPVMEFGCVCIMRVDRKLLYISMSVCPLGTVFQQVAVWVWQPRHLLQAHTQWWSILTRGRFTQTHTVYTQTCSAILLTGWYLKMR